jgi:prepilin-type N-terminal cleavage/methylation domain-containing protein/prepilin-type processing-associated H-X9-DG protein
MSRHHRVGFTLIELLAVIALMALLAALLFPVFAQAREKARQAGCSSNLHQLATAMTLYSEAYDERLPPALGRDRDDSVSFPMTWMGRLEPYLGSCAVFIDRSSGHTNADWRSSSDLLKNYAYAPSRHVVGLDGQFMHTASGTAMWEGLGGFYGPPIGEFWQAAPSYSQAQIARPGETILICDHLVWDWGVSVGQMYYPALRHLREPPVLLPDGREELRGILNVVMVDGHVRGMTHAQFWEIRPNTQGGKHRFDPDVYLHFWPED